MRSWSIWVQFSGFVGYFGSLLLEPIGFDSRPQQQQQQQHWQQQQWFATKGDVLAFNPFFHYSEKHSLWLFNCESGAALGSNSGRLLSFPLMLVRNNNRIKSDGSEWTAAREKRKRESSWPKRKRQTFKKIRMETKNAFSHTICRKESCERENNANVRKEVRTSLRTSWPSDRRSF